MYAGRNWEIFAGMWCSGVVYREYEKDIIFIPENASDCTFEAGYLRVKWIFERERPADVGRF